MLLSTPCVMNGILKSLRSGPGSSFIVCLAVMLFLFAVSPVMAASGQRSPTIRPSTMPVNIHPSARQYAVPRPDGAYSRSLQSRQRNVDPAKLRSSSPRKKADPALNSGLQGFCANPFGLDRDSLGITTPEAQKIKSKVAQTNGSRHETPSDESGQVTVTSKTETPPDNRLVPHRAVFSGGPHTLPHMENEPNPEVSMSYKVNPIAATRFVVNPQDSGSPLYRPAEKNGKIYGGGVYMDVDLREDLQLQMGGEYSEIDNQHTYGTESVQGASVGLRWSF